ncbi:MAG: CBS domain-containing protein [Chloroflexota bacterium]
MTTVRSLLQKKGAQVFTVSPETPVLEAMKALSDHDIGALVVIENGQVCGIFTERDYARKIILLGRASKNTTVRQVMSSPVVSVRPQQTLLECMAMMSKRKIRYLPVIEGGEIKGILSIGDVLNAVIAEQGQALDRLEKAGRANDDFLI